MQLASIPLLVLLVLDGASAGDVQTGTSLAPAVAEGTSFRYRLDITTYVPPDEWPTGETDSGVLRVLVKQFRPGKELRLVFVMEGVQKIVTARFDGRGRLDSVRAIGFDGGQIQTDEHFDGLLEPGDMSGLEQENQAANIIAGQFLYQFLHVIDPGHPVRPGESWMTTVANPVASRRPVHFRSTYVGKRVLGGQPVLEVRQIGVMATDNSETPGLMTARSRFWLNPKTRAIVRAEARVAGLPQPGGHTIWAAFVLSPLTDAASR
jgi:hypothetical protein